MPVQSKLTLVNQDNPKEPEILNYAAPAKARKWDPNNRLLVFRLLWVGVLFFSLVSGSIGNNDFGGYFWIVPGLIALALAGVGINGNRSKFRKSRVIFILKAVIWLLPLAYGLLLVNKGYESQQMIKSSPTRSLIRDMNVEIIHEIAKDEGLDPSLRRPVSGIIQDILKKSPSDQWGRTFRFSYPGTSRHNAFGIFSAGPDGVYGNADDIGNW
jgi:hypothetical protein